MLFAVLISFAEEGVDVSFFFLDLSTVPYEAVATQTRRNHVIKSRETCRQVARLALGNDCC